MRNPIQIAAKDVKNSHIVDLFQELTQQVCSSEYKDLKEEVHQEIVRRLGQVDRLTEALKGLIGVDNKEELEKIEAVVRSLMTPEEDREVTINAITALKEVI